VATSPTDGARLAPSAYLAAPFAGRVALVTGAGSGIGLALVQRLFAAGAHTYGIVRRAEDVPADGPGVRWLVADVADRAAMAEAFGAVAAERGRLDVLVSNAGVARHGQLSEQSPDDVALVVDTNLHGFLTALAHGIPLLRKASGAAVVAVSSVHAQATAPLVAAYAASKAAIVGAARAAALDHAPEGIRINAVLPGSVDTPMLRASASRRAPSDPDGAVREWGLRHPIGRVLTADEVASAVLFLAGPGATGITGVALPVDGGLLARLAL
jgi:NAD(P)-dependent dehydrogenase (short-subunit alcohol dehydrogenase family)